VVEYDEDGKPVRMVGTYSDITTFKKTLQQLELSDKMRIEPMFQSEFLATMSHEVRTPLNAIMGMLHLLKDTELSEGQLDKVQIMHDASKQLLSVLNNVLDFSKIESGKLELEAIPFSLDEIVQQVFSMLAVKAEEKGLELLIRFSSAVPRMVVGDPSRLGQILTNLLTNAIKFTDHGEIELIIGVKNTDKHVAALEFSVVDTGIGLRMKSYQYCLTPMCRLKHRSHENTVVLVLDFPSAKVWWS